MTPWIPVSDPLPPDDTHTWARPGSEPCPDCDCCSKALCAKAVKDHSACHFLGTSSSFDLSWCPCWLSTPSKYPRGKSI